MDKKFIKHLSEGPKPSKNPTRLAPGDTFFTKMNDTRIKILNITIDGVHRRNPDTIIEYEYQTQNGRKGKEKKGLGSFLDDIINDD